MLPAIITRHHLFLFFSTTVQVADLKVWHNNVEESITLLNKEVTIMTSHFFNDLAVPLNLRMTLVHIIDVKPVRLGDDTAKSS